MVRQVVLFFVLTLILTVILAGGQEATGLLAGQVILAQLAPGLTSVILALIAPGIVMMNRQTFFKAPRSQVA